MSSHAETRMLTKSASASDVKSAERVHHALTAKLEKRALIYFAERMPKAVNSDHLTLLGLIAQFLAGLCYVFSRWNKYALLLACLFIALNWFGDSLDGTLARVRNCQRPRYGFYVDHVIDAFGAVFLMCGLGFSGLLHWPVAMAMLIAFLLIFIETCLATYSLNVFKMSQGIFGPTELRILLIIGNLALLWHPYATLFGRHFLFFDVGGSIGAAGMFALVVAATIRHTSELYRQEPMQ